MTIGTSNVLWLIAIVLIGILVVALLRRPHDPHVNREELIEESRRAATDAVRDTVERVQNTVVADYQRREEQHRQDAADKRKESSEKARLTKAAKLQELTQWREPFIAIVKRLAQPYFMEWELSDALLDEWAEQRADFYIRQKPYILQVIQSIHADAIRSAEKFANQGNKSPSEIARQRATSVSRGLARNDECPYCGAGLNEKMHLDHIVPVQRGGPSEAWNLVFVCIPCNRAKRDLSLMEFVDTDYALRNGLKISLIVKRLKELDKFFEALR